MEGSIERIASALERIAAALEGVEPAAPRTQAAEKQAEGKPAEKQAEGKPAEKQAEGKAAEKQAEGKAAEKVPSLDDVVAALQKYMAANGRGAAVELLARYKAKRASDVPEADRAAFVKEAA